MFAPDLDHPHEEPRDSLDTLFMNSNKVPDLVQDMTTDCSVVAGLSAAIKILTGKHSVGHLISDLWAKEMNYLMCQGSFLYHLPL